MQMAWPWPEQNFCRGSQESVVIRGSQEIRSCWSMEPRISAYPLHSIA